MPVYWDESCTEGGYAMVADPKRELHALIDHLDADDTANTLAYARSLIGIHIGISASASSRPVDMRQQQSLPTLHSAPAIRTIDDLRTDVFGADEDGEEFEYAIRRWREEAEGV